MPAPTLDPLLDRLERCSLRRAAGDGREAAQVLARLTGALFTEAAALVRCHELLLFLRAYPHDRAVLRRAESLLVSFHRRVESLRSSPSFEPASLTRPEVSGIAGTSLSINWCYDLVRHLAARHPGRIDIDWEVEPDEPTLAAVLRCLSPLFEDGAYAEYPVPVRRWVQAARSRRERDLAWLLRRFEAWPLPEREKAALFDATKLYLEWKLGSSSASRTRARRPVRDVFFHPRPLLRRGEVSLAEELEQGSPLPAERLSRKEGEEVLALGRDAMSVRSRELHGFTYGDSNHVLHARAGRGVELFVWGVPPARRLPLLAYHAVLIVKNGVPSGYAEALSFCERSEVGFNLFYSFRDGESAWVYARLLRLFRQQLGLTVFSIDPYQIGFHNAEAIESGAFWFYRKLGFRPVVPELVRKALAEERKIARRPGYRTSQRTLRQLAAGHLLLEAPSTVEPGAWDRFRIGNLGLAAERRVTARFGGDEAACRAQAESVVAKRLSLDPNAWNATAQQAFSNLAMVLADSPDLARWSAEEKRAVGDIALAKAGANEARYLGLLRRHSKLRREMLRLGARQRPPLL